MPKPARWKHAIYHCFGFWYDYSSVEYNPKVLEDLRGRTWYAEKHVEFDLPGPPRPDARRRGQGGPGAHLHRGRSRGPVGLEPNLVGVLDGTSYRTPRAWSGPAPKKEC